MTQRLNCDTIFITNIDKPSYYILTLIYWYHLTLLLTSDDILQCLALIMIANKLANENL